MKALRDAIKSENDQKVASIFRQGVDRQAIDSRDQGGRTALHLAIMKERDDLVRQLVELGASLDARDRNGDAPLHTAVHYGNEACLSVLLELGADINVLNTSSGFTPLHVAAWLRQAKRARMLVDAGADLGARNHQGHTPLHTAASWDSLEVAALLIRGGADLDALDLLGERPEDIRKDHPELSPLFQCARAEVAMREASNAGIATRRPGAVIGGL